MQKLPLRPLRLVHVGDAELDEKYNSRGASARTDTQGKGIEAALEKSTYMLQKNMAPEKNLAGNTEAQHLLRRTPSNYLFSQANGLWLILSLFLLNIIITHNITTNAYGAYVTIQAVINTISYVVALGLEDATATFIPRVLSEHGRAAAAYLVRRLFGVRLCVLLLSCGIILFSLPPLATLIALIPLTVTKNMAASLHNPTLLAHTGPIAVYIVGSGIANLFTALCAALMRMRRVLVISGLAQLALLVLGFLALQRGLSIDGILWLQAFVSVFSASAFIIWQARLLFARGASYKQPFKPVMQLGLSAWIANLVSGALLKQVAIILLSIYIGVSVRNSAIAYFNIAFQLADGVNILLVAGFSGVGAAALSAAFVGRNIERLGSSWQALIKVETLLAAPGLVFGLFNASTIIHIVYGSTYDAAGPLLAIFLFFNIIVRVIGTTIHQAALYVIGKPRWVVLVQWISLLLVTGGGIAFIPRLGVAGALLADGLAKAVTGILLLIFMVRTLPRRYPLELLNFTLRFLLALIIAALPGILWHPSNSAALVLSGLVFIVLCILLLWVIKPLSASDGEMIKTMNAKFVPLLRPFVRKG